MTYLHLYYLCCVAYLCLYYLCCVTYFNKQLSLYLYHLCCIIYYLYYISNEHIIYNFYNYKKYLHLCVN